MIKTVQISVRPEEAGNEQFLRILLSKEVRESDFNYKITKRSIDARRRKVKINLTVNIYINEDIPDSITFIDYPNVASKEPVLIVGFGPAGMFAALKLIELGYKPIVVERGKDVKRRRRDLAAITKEQIVNPESNYCFGEGGAGTYSDGKLYTRSKKRGDVRSVLETLVQHGATEDILVDAHPHIGTNKLPQVVTAIRETIESCGGEIHFEAKLTDLLIKDNEIKGIEINNSSQLHADNVILGTGHSARDIFYLFHQKGILIENKPFALGVRVEHDQRLIDSIQYHCEDRGEYLPPSSYKLIEQVKNRGVFSFCMCPGGIIAPCATAPGEIVTNGWSPSRRNNPYANSGIVVSVEPEDLKKYQQHGPLAGLEFQKEMERNAFELAGNNIEENQGQIAPAQRLVDFTQQKLSNTLPDCSYRPGIQSTDLNEVLSEGIAERLRVGFKAFGNKMRGYFTNEAIIVGVESRTSSPVKIPRDKITLEHVQVKGLYPCGEGAGYAGGIVSAAIDGQKCAMAIKAKS